MLTIEALLRNLRIPNEQLANTYFQWTADSPTSQPLLGSISIADIGRRQLCADLEVGNGGEKEKFSLEIDVDEAGQLAVEPGSLLERQLQVFVESVRDCALTVVGEA